ncbi:3'-5' exonuclease [Campylobacter lari]|uniref:3'-5' exonuclease n=1 Tax=Campylobacter lari TaxID=201 RepID=UPI001F09DB77|nr:3'-5' exonuclease [Campylobacter lari]MCH3696237.1 3'-5' exonuclease [Campylobacter lari]
MLVWGAIAIWLLILFYYCFDDFVKAFLISSFILFCLWLLTIFVNTFKHKPQKTKNQEDNRASKDNLYNTTLNFTQTPFNQKTNAYKKSFNDSSNINQNFQERILPRSRNKIEYKPNKNDEMYPYNYSELIPCYLQTNPKEYFTKDDLKLNVIVIDTETTGLREWEDEILQLSIIDETGYLIFDKYFKPKYKSTWIEAQKIHGIKPAFVQNKASIDNYKIQLEKIFNDADVIIGYNLDFDLKFIKRVIDFKKPMFCIDVMKLFTSYYHEESSILPNVDCGYSYKKLTFAAWHFKNPNALNPLNFHGAHGALEDARATLYVLTKLEQTLSSTPNYKNFRKRLGFNRIIDLFYQDFLKKEEEELNKQKLKSDIKDNVDKLYNEMIATLGSDVKISKIIHNSYATFYIKNQKKWIMKVYFNENAKAQKALLNIPNSKFRKVDEKFFIRQKKKLKEIINSFIIE